LAWTKRFNPSTKQENCWTKREEKKLIELAKENDNHNWEDIANKLGGSKSLIQCLRHYQQALNPCLVKSVWNEKEDCKLTEEVEKFKGTNVQWNEVALNVTGRSSHQCQSRWNESVKFRSKRKEPWTKDELRRLCLSARAFSNPLEAKKSNPLGVNWVTLSSFMLPGRSTLSCRDKWNEELNPKITRSEWSLEEDMKLVELVESLGEGNWSKIAAQMVNRTDMQVRVRWTALNPDFLPTAHLKKRGGGVLPMLLQRRKKERPALTVEDFDLFGKEIVIKDSDL